MQRRRVKQHRTNSPLQKKVRLKKLHVKTMPNVFFNADRIMHSKFVHEGTTVNSHYYLGVMECPHACMRHVSNRQFHGNSLLLSHDMPTHCTLNEKQFLASKSIHVWSSITPTHQIWHQHFSLFPKMKLALNGQCFSNISDTKRGVTELPKWVSLQDFQCNLGTCINDLSIVWWWGEGAILF